MPNRKLEKAKEMIDKKLLIGLTYLNSDGTVIEHTQMHGKIVSVETDCVRVELEGTHKGENMALPRDLRSYKKAEPGTYTLKATGEEIEDPDYTTTWAITKKKPDAQT